MRRFTVFALVSMLAVPAAAAPTIYRSTYRGDGFDGSLGMSDGCRSIDVYFAGSDYTTKSQPGAPQTANSLWGYVWMFDCDTQSWGSAYFDQTNSTVNAQGTQGTATFSTSVEIAFGHWEPSEEQYCYEYDAYCWIDELGNEYCEPAGQYCYPAYWYWVEDESQTLALDLALTPTGDVYRGMNVSTQKTPWGMYRYRSVGAWKPATISGTATLDGESVLGTAYSYSYGGVWNTNAGSLERYEF